MAATEFWALLVELGLIEGDPTYYSTGKATPEEVQHAISVAMAADRVAFVDAAFETGVAQGDPSYWYTTPAEGDDALIKAVAASGAPSAGVDTEAINTAAAESQTEEGVGGMGPGDVPLTILTGEKMEWYFDQSTGKWYVEYGLPNSERSVVFEAEPDQMDALFGTGQRPTRVDKTFEQIIAGGATFSGNIGEMEGTGSFESEVKRITALGLDDGTLPAWATETGAIMDLVYIAQAQGKSQEWLIAQIATTEEFKARFPGLDKIRTTGNLTLVDAITGFLEFEAGVRSAIKAVGGNEDAVTADVIGGLLEKGHSLTTVTEAVSRFDRMTSFGPAMEAFNRILVEQDKDPITSLQDMFDFLGGNAGSDVYEIWEASSVAEAASAAGLGDVFTAEDAMAFAIWTEGNATLGELTGGFQDAARLLLRLRNEVDLGRFGLNLDDIIDLSLQQPLRSGGSLADLNENISRAVLGAQKGLQKKAKPFQGFTKEGTIQSQSLGGLRSQQ